MTARFAAETTRASHSDSSATMTTTVETGLMSQWNVASRFYFALNIHQYYLNMLLLKAALKLKKLFPNIAMVDLFPSLIPF